MAYISASKVTECRKITFEIALSVTYSQAELSEADLDL